MKEPRTEKIVSELKDLTLRLNKLDLILQKMDVSYSLSRTTKTDTWKLTDIIQKVEY